MKIEIWSDYACPFCYIGKERLQRAIRDLNMEDKVEIELNSFQLNVNAKRVEDKDIHKIISEKYGIPYEQAKSSNSRIVDLAKSEGLNFDFDAIKPGNTALAHALFKYANSVNKGNEVSKLLFKAYFEDGIDISDLKELTKIAENVGISKSDFGSAINDTKYHNSVKEDQSTAQEIGVTSVPFFVIDGKNSVTGAQDVDTFKDILKQLI